MNAFSAGVHHHHDGKLQLQHQAVLAGKLKCVAFDQRVAVFGNVFVFYALAVQGIESDPRAGVWIVVAQGSAQVAVAFVQLLDELPRGAVVCALGWYPTTVLGGVALGHVADRFRGFKEQG